MALVLLQETLLITWIFSFTRVILFIRMANFQSPFTKRRPINSCTSRFDLSIRGTPSRTMFGESLNDTCVIIRRKKTSLNSKHVSFLGYVTEALRSISWKNYFNTSHIRKGMNCSTQRSPRLLFVNHLHYRKQRRGSSGKEMKFSTSRKRKRQLSSSTQILQIPTRATTTSATTTTTTTQVWGQQASGQGSLQLKVGLFFLVKLPYFLH